MSMTRRGLMGAIGATTLASNAAVAARASAPLRGRRLREGDVVGLIEPATATFEPFDVTLVEESLAAMGLRTKRGASVLTRHGYFAGEDADRAKDVNAMFRDKSVSAVLAVRGGWGSARILPFLDYAAIRANPKPLIGYSDITALHLAIFAKSGLVAFHGPNGASAWGELSLATFKPLLFEAATPHYVNPVAAEDRLSQRLWRTQTITSGRARGRLVGGNLTVMTALVGTPYFPDLDGAILFLEDIGEAIYRVDRMLTQLGQAGALARLAGVIFGGCTDCDVSEGDYSSFTLGEVLEQHLRPLRVPAYRGAFIGHMADQFTVPIGALAELDADAGAFRLLEPAVL
jgi:muramoyltetrapeptide carboxypeptidase